MNESLNESREIPGTILNPGRWFRYVQSLIPGETSMDLIEVIVDYLNAHNTGLFKGGFVSERIQIMLPDLRRFVGISFRGDLNAWDSCLKKFCEDTGRHWGLIRDNVFVVSDGTEFAIDKCEKVFK